MKFGLFGSGRSRVRRILLTCIQMLLIQFLEVIWSMPKNFAFFQKPLDKFFYKFDNSEIVVHVHMKLENNASEY